MLLDFKNAFILAKPCFRQKNISFFDQSILQNVIHFNFIDENMLYRIVYIVCVLHEPITVVLVQVIFLVRTTAATKHGSFTLYYIYIYIV